VITLGELLMILELHRQGVSVSAIARQLGIDRKTLRTYIGKGLEPPVYEKRAQTPSIVAPYEPYLRERLAAYPALTGRRLWRETKERGFTGCYSLVRDCLRELRPPRTSRFEVCFETPPGEQAQVDFARLDIGFLDELGVKRVVWLFSMVLSHSRFIWARFVRCLRVKARMRPSRIVEALDVSPDRGPRLGDAIVGAQIDLLILDCSPEPFDKDVVSPSPLCHQC